MFNSLQSEESDYHDNRSPLTIGGPSSSSTVSPLTINNLNNFNAINDNQPLNIKNNNNSIAILDLYPKINFNLPMIGGLPKRVGYFSVHVSPNGHLDAYQPNLTSLTYLKPNYLDYKNIDLLEGYPIERQYFPIPRETGHILQWSTASQFNQATCSDIHFICTSSRILKLILDVPHNHAVQWTTLAIKIGSSIVLTIRDPSTMGKNIFKSSDSKQIKNIYCGCRLSDLVTLKSNERPAESHLVGNRESFYMVNKFTAGSHKILYPTRIDCLIDKSQFTKPIGKMETALIKKRPCTNQYPRRQSEADVTRAIDWWSDAFLSGSEKIVCGEKEVDSTHLQDITLLNAETLLSTQSESLPQWSPRLCVEHLNYILDVIWYNVREEKAVYSFRWNRKKQGLEYTRLADSYKDHIPNWYCPR